jgi:hypothetical protein
MSRAVWGIAIVLTLAITSAGIARSKGKHAYQGSSGGSDPSYGHPDPRVPRDPRSASSADSRHDPRHPRPPHQASSAGSRHEPRRPRPPHEASSAHGSSSRHGGGHGHGGGHHG